jgi:hypothetical protein
VLDSSVTGFVAFDAAAGVARLKTLRSNHSGHLKMDCALVNSTTELSSMTPTMSNGHTAPASALTTTGHPVVTDGMDNECDQHPATEVDRQHHLDVEHSRRCL